MKAILDWIEHTLWVAADFASHLLLLAQLSFVVSVLFLGLGRGFGLPRLFWHEVRWKQGIAGFGAVLLAAELFFVSYLLVVREGASRGRDVALAKMSSGVYLLHGATALAVALVVPLALFFRGAAGARAKERWPMALGAALGAGAIAALVLLGDFMASRASPGICAAFPQIDAALGSGSSCRELVHHHVLATSFFLLLLVVYVSAALFHRIVIPPAVGLCILNALVAAAFGFFSFWLGSLHVLLLVAIAAVLVWLSGRDPYKRRIEALSAFYALEALSDLARYEVGKPGSVGLLRAADVPFRDALPYAKGKRPLVLVCASGGGLRAAVWTTGVLCALEQRLPGFAYHVRLVSGASGGMVGAGAWAATVKAPPKEAPGPEDELHVISRAELIEQAGRDCLSEVTQRLVFRDIPSRLLPLRYTHDRGAALEDAFRRNMPDAFGKTFGDLLPGESAGWRPTLVYTPMLAEDGRRLVVSNLDLDFMLVQEGPRIAHAPGALYSRSGFELGRLFRGALSGFPVRSAARMSASFPFLSPAAALPTNPRRRVLDAGYFDNYGTSVACAFLEAAVTNDSRAGGLGRWLRENVSGVLLVEIRDGVETRSADGMDFRLERRMPKAAIERGLEGLTSPIEGALSARAAAMLFRNDEQIESVARRFDAEFGPGFFSTVAFCFRGHVSLSWSLTEMEKQKLVRGATRVVDEHAATLESWWSDHGGVARQTTTKVA